MNTMPLSVSVDAGPVAAQAARNVVHHDRAGDPAVGGDRQGVAGVIVEPGQDLDVGAVGEAVVGEVGLPGLVRLVGFEADVGGAGPLLGLRGDQPGAVQGAVDRGSVTPGAGGGARGASGSCPSRRPGPGRRGVGGADDQLDGRCRAAPSGTSSAAASGVRTRRRLRRGSGRRARTPTSGPPRRPARPRPAGGPRQRQR